MDPVHHFQLPAKDMALLRPFYEGVFGWQIQEVPGMDYHLIATVPTDGRGWPTVPGGINGGFYRPGPQSPAGVQITISVGSMDETLRKIEASGGRVLMPKTPVGGFGFYAQIADPEGTALGVWQDVTQ
ncbi:MAG: VOC family protein [Candidatus Tectomicrobia bacterium]|uniref:VOC family protein n=1 Tax=Tectimicrobiota bacterium TaxID=2528274 RepID=A0A933EA25_UNCTE|nr:VOC family protein [Candidatus Tectomicrobia bacterium]